MWKKNLTVTESDIIAKYFNNSGNKWRPSLIAFPHFQTFPCRVHIVMHSCRTSMMIDAMQHLQGVLLSRDKDGLSVEVCSCPVNPLLFIIFSASVTYSCILI